MSWVGLLDSLPGLTTNEQGRARIVLLSMGDADRDIVLSGQPEVAAAAVQALLTMAGQ